MAVRRKLHLKKIGKSGIKMVLAGIPFAIIYGIMDYICDYRQMYPLRVVLALIADVLIIGGLILFLFNIKILKGYRIMVDSYLDRIRRVYIKGKCYSDQSKIEKKPFNNSYEASVSAREDRYEITIESAIFNDDYGGVIEKFALLDGDGNIIKLDNYYYSINTRLAKYDLIDIIIKPKNFNVDYKWVFQKGE